MFGGGFSAGGGGVNWRCRGQWPLAVFAGGGFSIGILGSRVICCWPFLVEADSAVAAGHFGGDIFSAREGGVLAVLESGFNAGGLMLKPQGAAAAGPRPAEAKTASRSGTEVCRGLNRKTQLQRNREF